MSADPITDQLAAGELFGVETEPDYDSAPEYGITDHKAAEYLRIVGDLDFQRARLERFAREEIAIITDRLAQRIETFDKAKRWHLQTIEEFARREIDALPKDEKGNPIAKTIDLLCGQLKLTAPSKDGRLIVTDKEAFETWAATATLPTAVPGIRVTFAPDAKVLKSEKVFKRAEVEDAPGSFGLILEGEQVPGIAIVIDEVDTFSYSVTAR
jgi:phage host-nuclease inhibitor protein Gam